MEIPVREQAATAWQMGERIAGVRECQEVKEKAQKMSNGQFIEFNDYALPFKLSAQSRGAQKAYQGMVKQYGLDEGRRIFLAKANERGAGTTIRQRVNDTYKTGAKLNDKRG